MKKSLIALAVVAASGAAMAQSSVTVYGRIDASVGSTKNTVTGVSTTKMFSGNASSATDSSIGTNSDNANLTGSRWGLKGVEDLGGGLKAVFAIENRFNADDGTDTGGFLGDAYVGLSGDFGTVHLGRTYSAYDGVKGIAVSNSVLDSGFTPNAVTGYNSRHANGIKYVSPTFAGFTAAASVGLSENNANDNAYTVSAIYGAGPLKAGLAYEDKGSTGATDNGSNVVVAGAYDFGVAAISAAYTQFNAAAGGNDADGYNLGVTVPFGAFKFSVGYASRDTDNTDKQSGIGMAVAYSLSKRTTAYAGYSDVKTKNAGTGAKTAGTRKFALGVRHDF